MSTTSASSASTTSSTISSTTSSTFAPIPIHHAVTIRLSKTNYMLWRAQLLPYLRSVKLIGYIDGTITAPSQFVAASSAEGAAQVPNPAYERWYDQDQQLLSGLLSSMSEDLLLDVVSASTAKEAWDILQRMFSSAVRARAIQVRVDLATLKKRDLPANEYFRKVKNLAYELAAAGLPLRDDEIIAYLLAGLRSDYDSFVTSMTTKSEALSLDDVYAHLLAYESRHLQHQAETRLHVDASANYAGRGAVKCWYRMDETYQEDPPFAAAATTTSYKVDPNWYADTGATDHITSDLDRLALRDQYHGGETVQVGNGAGPSNEASSSGRTV
ncbi:hypothetical protein QOZ80_4AG0310050 [Eleusine coracana subsp. coracana]|nr:hypothetical protein QOZ80_4AG0310050 [Eleusine coracana subsp. coracana]